MIFSILAVPLASVVGAQEAPKDLAQWDLICFCNTTVSTPHPIVRADNNGQILYLARNGVTRDQLKDAEVPFNESQLHLLQDWRLLRRDPKILRTAIPVLGPEEVLRLRAFLQKETTTLAPIVEPDVRALVQTLKEQGYAQNAFAIVFSYLLDGVVWGRFDEAHLLPEMQVTADKPFWNGAFWAMYPKRTGAPGTNTWSDGNWTLAVTWTQPVLSAIAPVSHSSVTNPLFAHLKEHGVVTDPAVRAPFVALGIVTSDGKPAVPVIHEDPEDPVYRLSSTIAQKISARMLELQKDNELASLTQSLDERQVLLISYHELMWELLAEFEHDGLVQEPEVLSSHDPIRPVDVGALVLCYINK